VWVARAWKGFSASISLSHAALHSARWRFVMAAAWMVIRASSFSTSVMSVSSLSLVRAPPPGAPARVRGWLEVTPVEPLGAVEVGAEADLAEVRDRLVLAVDDDEALAKLAAEQPRLGVGGQATMPATEDRPGAGEKEVREVRGAINAVDPEFVADVVVGEGDFAGHRSVSLKGWWWGPRQGAPL